MRNLLVVNAGQLRHRITIQQQAGAVTPADVTGMIAAQGEWLDSGRADDVGMGIATQSAPRRPTRLQQFAAQVTHVITIRWPGGRALWIAGQICACCSARAQVYGADGGERAGAQPGAEADVQLRSTGCSKHFVPFSTALFAR